MRRKCPRPVPHSKLMLEVSKRLLLSEVNSDCRSISVFCASGRLQVFVFDWESPGGISVCLTFDFVTGFGDVLLQLENVNKVGSLAIFSTISRSLSSLSSPAVPIAARNTSADLWFASCAVRSTWGC